jgi:hypothetical protein
MGHVWSQYQYPIPKNTYKIQFWYLIDKYMYAISKMQFLIKTPSLAPVIFVLWTYPIQNFPIWFSQEQKKKLTPKALPFTIIQRQMYKHGHDQVLRGNVHLDQILTILHKMH